MKRGTVILTPFPFTDLSTIKRRPALIISKDEPAKNDVIVMFISSKIPQHLNKSDFLLKHDHKDFKNTGLLKRLCFQNR